MPCPPYCKPFPRASSHSKLPTPHNSSPCSHLSTVLMFQNTVQYTPGCFLCGPPQRAGQHTPPSILSVRLLSTSCDIIRYHQISSTTSTYTTRCGFHCVIIVQRYHSMYTVSHCGSHSKLCSVLTLTNEEQWSGSCLILKTTSILTLRLAPPF